MHPALNVYETKQKLLYLEISDRVVRFISSKKKAVTSWANARVKLKLR